MNHQASMRGCTFLTLFLLLSACNQDGPSTGQVILPTAESSAAAGLTLRAVSTKPWLVTGGDVLVELQLPLASDQSRARVLLNADDITANFRSVDNAGKMQALISGLELGDSRLSATITGSALSTSLTLSNYPLSGPIISGPHEQPYYCQSEQFTLVTGEFLGPALDENCAVMTRVDYVYFSSEAQDFKPYSAASPGSYPADMSTVSLPGGSSVPFIVRVETGTVNRAIYEIAMLHDPAFPAPDLFTRSSGWNGKLVYTHGGGCRGGWYQQGRSTGGVLRKGLLEMGYALSSATHNVFGQNCNDLLASETHIMVKERFIEHYGEPVYTIATGASGGSYQSHQTADNYPGVFDGIIVSSSFPDVTSATIFTLADARLLNHYFTSVNPEGFTTEQQRLISGFGSWGSIANLAAGAARLDPVYGFDTPAEEQGGEFNLAALRERRYDPATPAGVRATVYDHTVNVYGLAEDAPVAARPLDNVGVQYGLTALNAGTISMSQFIDLNRSIGGFDRDLNHIPERHRADARASQRAIESGRILYGGAGLATTPVIDYRSYTDHQEAGDIHMLVHQFSTRQRLFNANGQTDNHVMTIGGRWGFTPDEADLGNLFRELDHWLMALKNTNVAVDPVARVRSSKPATLVDNCWDNTAAERVNIAEPLSLASIGKCLTLYPVYSTPRQVAGAPLANDIVSCQLKPLDPQDYKQTFSAEELLALEEIFPDGVCDWSKPDAHASHFQGSWLSFGPSPVNRLP